MFNRFLGLLPIFYSAYEYYNWYSTPGFNPSNIFWAKLGVSFLIGFVMLVISNYDYVLKYVSKTKLLSSTQSDDDKLEEESPNEYYDLTCLLHLRSRVTDLGSQEGVEIVTRLNTILFSKGKI